MADVFKLVPSNISGLVSYAEKLLADTGEVYFQVVSKEKAKTLAQNKTFHKLVNMWHKSGYASYDNVEKLRNWYKLNAGIIHQYLYWDGEKIAAVKEAKDLPPDVPKSSCRAIPGSWSNATKGQAIKAIDLLIADMLNSGFSSKEFDQMITEFRERRW